VKVLADGTGMPEQSDQALGEVAVVGQSPDAGPVAGNDDRRTPAHTVDDRVRLLPTSDDNRDLGRPVGQRGPDDCRGEARFTLCPLKDLLARDLVERVLPERVTVGVASVISQCEGGFSYTDAELMNTYWPAAAKIRTSCSTWPGR